MSADGVCSFRGQAGGVAVPGGPARAERAVVRPTFPLQHLCTTELRRDRVSRTRDGRSPVCVSSGSQDLSHVGECVGHPVRQRYFSGYHGHRGLLQGARVSPVRDQGEDREGADG